MGVDTGLSGRFPFLRAPFRPAIRLNDGKDHVEYHFSGGRPISQARPPLSYNQKQDSSAGRVPEIEGQLDLNQHEAFNKRTDIDNRNTNCAVGQGPANSFGRKYIPLALCFSDRLLEPAIVIQNEHDPDDKIVMGKIQQAYWEARGSWKRWFSYRKIWPWKILHRIGYMQVTGSSIHTDR